MCVGQLRSRGGVGVTSLLVILSRYNFLLKKYGVRLKNTTTEEVPRLSPAPTEHSSTALSFVEKEGAKAFLQPRRRSGANWSQTLG